jgi:hypothetical protein
MMLRTALALTLILSLGGGVMAAPSARSVDEKPKGREPSAEEMFWESQEGKDIELLYDQMISGKIDFDEAQRRYNKKWADKPIPGGKQPVQLPRMRQ